MSDMVKFLHEEPVTTRIVSTLDQAAKINNLIDGVYTSQQLTNK